ncbi:TniB family NTP-binding protein [Ensifer soli]|uniref:TniB family NTP-binding protein n=1 Tax=Ciceribacter sp. sgz301302 TaxID=3342379 RepID=UPI0035B8F61F
MTMMFPIPKFHLSVFTDEERRELIPLMSDKERRRMSKFVLVEHEQFEDTIEFIRERLHFASNYPEPHDDDHREIQAEGWIGGVIGAPRTGKSFIAQYYTSLHPPVFKQNGGWKVPVAYIEARSDWDRKEFAKQIYWQTKATALPRLTIASMNSTVTSRLRDMGVRLLIIDDAQFLFDTTYAKAHTHKSMLHHIANAMQCNILLVGTEEVENAIYAEDRLRGRGDFPSPDVLVGFDPKDPDGRIDFREFLAEIEKRLPFQAVSDLNRRDWIDDFFEACGGSRGRAMNYIVAAAYAAITDRSPCIQLHHLQQAAKDRTPSGKAMIPFVGRRKKKENGNGL